MTKYINNIILILIIFILIYFINTLKTYIENFTDPLNRNIMDRNTVNEKMQDRNKDYWLIYKNNRKIKEATNNKIKNINTSIKLPPINNDYPFTNFNKK